jgi:hypothetical protein
MSVPHSVPPILICPVNGTSYMSLMFLAACIEIKYIFGARPSPAPGTYCYGLTQQHPQT